MIVGYFTNQYPAGSHSFIRREIRALERRGNSIRRYALRPGMHIVDEADQAERAITGYVLRQSPVAFAAAALRTLVRHPLGAIRALLQAASLGWKSDAGLIRHLAYWGEALVLADWCRRDKVEHLHAHFGTNSAAVALLVHQISGLPFSFTVHGPDEFDKPEALGLGEKVGSAAFVVAVSSFGRSQLMRWVAPEHWSKIKVVHCGLDATYVGDEEAGSMPGDQFVCIGRLSAQKGHLLLLEAMRHLRDEGITPTVVLIGDGPLRHELERRIARYDLRGQVKVMGWLSGADVKKEIRSSRALVLPSFAEGLPVVIMEAMALKRPVIATSIAGIPELVIPGETGWLAPAGDASELSECIRRALFLDDAALIEMGSRARTRVLMRHQIDAAAGRLETHITSPNRKLP